MHSSKCFLSTAVALHRIFVFPLEQRQLQFALQASQASRPLPKRFLPPSQQHKRCYRAGTRPVKSRLPQNEEIRDRSIVLVDEDGKLGDEHRTRWVLDRMDLKEEALVMVAEAEEDRSAVCKIINRKEHYAAERAKKKNAVATKDPSKTLKTIELNWAIDRNDLAHRMDRLKEFLSKGYRVDLLLQRKRRGKEASPEQAKALVDNIQATVESVDAKEHKPMEGALLQPVKLFFEGKVKK